MVTKTTLSPALLLLFFSGISLSGLLLLRLGLGSNFVLAGAFRSAAEHGREATKVPEGNVVAAAVAAAATGTSGSPALVGSVDAVYDLMDRVLKDPTAKNSFRLRIVSESETDNENENESDAEDNKNGRDSSSAPTAGSWFRLEQKQQQESNGDPPGTGDTTIVVTATSASELTAGLGYYFKHYCNFTIEWSSGGRAGGSHIALPEAWPVPLGPGPAVVRRRTTQWSYLMNVCTHSYSLVWHDWSAWQSLIDNMALRGINMVLALTGQEEIQYRVFSKLGLGGHDIRSWFNGPAFLTWSRGQNEYGSGIAGPLPRSFMKSQWALQRDHILPRLRSLGMVGILPAFQGNVPVQLANLYKDSNMTKEGDTGWIDALDPLFLEIADLWMAQLIEDFGTDHYYQLDGWFNGGVPPWMTTPRGGLTTSQARRRRSLETQSSSVRRTAGAIPPTVVPRDEDWYRRGQAAYAGLNRTDPDAHWMYQGFAFVGWETQEQASYVKGFVDSVPHGKFIVIDMEYSPDGEWQKWANASFFGAPFIWTKLHNFGDTTGMRGDIDHLNWAFPYQAFEAQSSIIGIGATPEGIDQNPMYYDFLYDQNFRPEPVENLTAHLIGLAHKRYGIQTSDENVDLAWWHLLRSSYSNDFSVQDLTGVAHLNPGPSSSLFEDDRSTPKPLMCSLFHAWNYLIHAGDNMKSSTDPFLYDLVNVGREVLAQLSTPMALNFSDARSKDSMDYQELVQTGESYIDLLIDLDLLLGTNIAFLVTPWLESARRLAREDATGGTQNDCFSPILGNQSNPGSCSRFYEFNARTQITTWNPTPHGADEVPGGPIDYAAKQWNGLIRGYYVNRAKILLDQALEDQQKGQPLNSTTVKRIFAAHAYEWTTAESSDSVVPPSTSLLHNERRSILRGTLEMSKEMLKKYSTWFKTCGHEINESQHSKS